MAAALFAPVGLFSAVQRRERVAVDGARGYDRADAVRLDVSESVTDMVRTFQDMEREVYSQSRRSQ
jgi:hypothetical protein